MSERFKYIPYSPYDENVQGLIGEGDIYNLKDARIPDGYNIGMNGILLRADDGTDAMMRDIEYMKDMYPDRIKAVSRAVEEECDKLEYEGSPMLMEYPDREEVRRVARKVYQLLDDSGLVDEEMAPSLMGNTGSGKKARKPHGCTDCAMRNIIELLVCNEFGFRRDRHRRRIRRFY